MVQPEGVIYTSLARIPAGTGATIVRLAEHDGDLLHWFYEQGLVPGTVLSVLRVDAAAGLLTVEIGGREHALSDRAAAGLFVLPAAA